MFATPNWSEEKLNHVASTLAELLDNDEDGCADDQNVLNELLHGHWDYGLPAVLLPDEAHGFDNDDVEKLGSIGMINITLTMIV